MIVTEVAGAMNELVQPRAEATAAAAGDGGLERTCLAVLRAHWTTLAVIALDPGAPARRVASAIADAAQRYRLRPVRALGGAGTPAPQIAALVDELASARGDEARTVITLEDPLSNPACMPLLVATDAVLLLVRLGKSEMRSIETTVELVGRERVVGCIVVR